MYDIIIIGGGPAGTSAAIFAAQAGKKTLVLDSDQGVTKKALVFNHYGIKEITGPELITIGHDQAKSFGAEIITTTVTTLAKTADGVKVTAQSGEYEGKNVILATGMMTSLAEPAGLTTRVATEPRMKAIFDVDAAGKTNIEGVWAAGPCAGSSVHTITSAGSGASVAINVLSEMNGARYVMHDILKKA